MLSVFSTVVILDSNTPNNNPTRAQIAQFGNDYGLDRNQYLPGTATYNPQWYRFYFYHIPTDFEYIGLTSDLGHGWRLDTKGYTYSYYNHQHYNNKTPISSSSAVDKLNSYNKAGDTLTLSSASRYGVFRTGLWYEWGYTDRYQTPSDPRTWVDQALPNFHENFWTNSVQPFAEYQLVAIPRWTITVGIKDAYYNMNLKQFADNGKIVGSLGGAPFVKHDAGYNSWLPSVEANYRIKSNWSAYAQYGRGSVIPPSGVFDVQNASVSGLPNPTIASTYQGGSVLKLNRMSLDGDVYYIHYQNAYSSYTDPSGFTYYYNNPASNTTGVEAEGNIAITRALSIFLNGTLDSAKYESQAALAAKATAPAIAASPTLWVASSPHDTESEGITYQDRHWDLGFFNKRVGTMWNDNGATHQAVPINGFSVSNLFLNYTVHNGSKLGESKFKLSFNNLFNNQNVVAITPALSPTATSAFTPNGGDQLTLLPARSVMLTVQFGLTPRER
jgi:iron complex outermembrane receptor protein